MDITFHRKQYGLAYNIKNYAYLLLILFIFKWFNHLLHRSKIKLITLAKKARAQMNLKLYYTKQFKLY